ncbi:FAS-associated death domain protein [Protopterus annectens]|uniref:FAS-associated death domain protein n=1 Tax=Protopterus annectens TaxID=7888 RepID=UPI001CFADB5D|nr:FAS-associated death domain protein [Protopterus annectens]
MVAFLDLLHTVSQKLKGDDLKALKFLCGDKIGKKKLESVESGTDLFALLIELNEISANNTSFLQEILNRVCRHDLADEVKRFDDSACDSSSEVLDQKEKDRLEIAYKVICGQVGKNWKMLARKLKIPEAKLDAIVQANPYDLQEQLMQSLMYWQKTKGVAAKAEDLVQALKLCQMNLVADYVMLQLDK